MKFSLFEFLYYAIPKDYDQAPEKKYFDAFSSVLSSFDVTRSYMDADSGFDYIQACVVIQSLRNKESIESYADLFAKSDPLDKTGLATIHQGLKHFAFAKREIYVPIFGPGINQRYDTEISALSKGPLKALRTVRGMESFFRDPFETYGLALYDSPFTRLMRIMDVGKETVFYSYSFDTIYCISDQGTCECTIPIFDRDLESPNRTDIPTRIVDLMKPYFAFNRTAFIDQLLNQGFISESLYGNIVKLSHKDEERRNSKKKNGAEDFVNFNRPEIF